ncbi:uncharacterized protein SCHCODRAFT_01344136 [Schizophyllum commune H4-8]|nr:uncharacterized protein SCHCODRAFT_01344136 [Schizophyllum commune H4-8]KAI5900856.1 hypothetical protein SCHCODRAFT_01344136 [Schizophyllum commune H4-8]
MRHSPSLDASPAMGDPKLLESVTAVVDTDEDCTPLDYEPTAVQSPPRKRQKTDDDDGGKAPSALNLHAPGSALLELPLDVLLEILTHVDPMSLRHVSRTSQALRDTLTGPRSDWIWRASYANTDHGLPPAPDDMTVPQFLSLLVDRVCDFCHASLIPKDQIKRIWAARIKCCLHCLYHSRDIVHEKDMDIFYLVRLIQRHLGPDFPLYKVFPASEDLGRSRSYPWVHINRLNQDYVRDKVGGGSVDDIKAWILQQAERHESVIKHAEACYEWERQEYWKRWEKEQHIRAERLEAIDQRLKDLDIDVDEPQEFKKQLSTRLTTPPTPPNYRHKYFPTPAYSTPIEIHKLVREARPLTEEDWSILLEWLLDAAKAEKRRQILEGRYSAFKKAYCQFLDRKSYRRQCLFPSICTVANWEEVVDLIEGTPLEQHLAADDMRVFIGKLARERFSQWRATFEAELVAKLNAADPTREQPATVADLKLATSVFSHRDASSGDPLRYPELLSWAPFSGDSFYRPDGSYYVVRKCPPWSAHEVRVDGWRRRLAARLVAMAGLDPATATYQEMSMQSVWFGRADEVSMLHCGEPAYLHRFSLTMCCAREKVDEYVVFTEAGVELARAWLQNPSALMCS